MRLIVRFGNSLILLCPDEPSIIRQSDTTILNFFFFFVSLQVFLIIGFTDEWRKVIFSLFFWLLVRIPILFKNREKGRLRILRMIVGREYTGTKNPKNQFYRFSGLNLEREPKITKTSNFHDFRAKIHINLKK